MSLYRRGRIWWIKLTANGSPVRESSGTADKKAAQEYHEKRRGEIWRQAKLGEAAPITWGEAVKKWLAIKPRGMPDRYRLRGFAIKPSSPLPLGSSQVSGFLNRSSAGSWNRELALVIAIHNAAGVQAPKVDRLPATPGRTRWLTAEEWGKLKSALAEESPLLLDAASFTLETGLRENNVLDLEWGQVDLQRRVAWLHGDQMKGKKALGVPLNDAACAILEGRKGKNRRYVFAHPESGKPLYKASNRAWYAALRKAKLRGFRWHDLRHTWASWHAMNGTRLEDIQHLGGWASPSMVQRYRHLSPEHLAEAAARVKPVSLGYNASGKALRDTKKGTKGR